MYAGDGYEYPPGPQHRFIMYRIGGYLLAAAAGFIAGCLIKTGGAQGEIVSLMQAAQTRDAWGPSIAVGLTSGACILAAVAMPLSVIYALKREREEVRIAKKSSTVD